MNADVRKQYLQLGGEPILLRTVKIFSACPFIESIWLAVPSGDVEDCAKMVGSLTGIAPQYHVITGGESRQESVYRGLVTMEKVMGPEDIIAIHDGVRPFVSKDRIENCLTIATKTGAAILATPVTDTVKQGEDKSGIISCTLDRKSLWLAQTPQMFRYGIIRDAHETAIREGLEATDDAMLVERTGVHVHVVPGSRKNIKITTPDDLSLGEAILWQEQKKAVHSELKER